ncbi:hypothetical protein cyc_03637 [Cyclospora cayetanensis]|uniref:RNA recognition motif-containing protein n=1 Tax=Cyclospora cayetanensis TaxID=88456 RepID=A0A1D3D830_9EIME|nr:hypothetical protein cyc_03637 [Cyclospora cayetanensis]
MGPSFRGGAGKAPKHAHKKRLPSVGHESFQKAARKKPRHPNGRNGVNGRRPAPLKENFEESQQQQHAESERKPQQARRKRLVDADIENESVTSALQQFGAVTKTFIVKNDAGEAKGAAFVYFADARPLAWLGSGAAVNNYGEVSGEGRQRLRALATESATKKGLSLAFEGLPRRPFEGLGPLDEALAKAAYDETKEKLKNPNIFVNKKRLCIRNLPSWVDANFLREKVSMLLGPILQSHFESPTADAMTAATAGQDGLAQEKQEQNQQKGSTKTAHSAKNPLLRILIHMQVSVIREPKKERLRKETSGAPGAPRRSLGFCFIDLGCDFAQALQLTERVKAFANLLRKRQQEAAAEKEDGDGQRKSGKALKKKTSKTKGATEAAKAGC